MKGWFDWKYLVMLLLAVAGVAVPVWLWKFDLTAKSLQFRVVSQTSLAPDVSGNLSGLSVTMNGLALEQPYLTLMQLENNGSKPIPTADFESGPELQIDTGKRFVNVEVTKAKPSALVAALKIESTRVTVQPLLLNPGDTLSFAILSSGGKPTFESRARVAGVSEVPLLDESTPKPSLALLTLEIAGALLALFSAALTMNLEPSRHFDVHLRSRSALVVFYTGFAAGGALVILAMEQLGYRSWWQPLVVLLALLLFLSFPARAWNRPSPTPPPGPKDVA